MVENWLVKGVGLDVSLHNLFSNICEGFRVIEIGNLMSYLIKAFTFNIISYLYV